MAATTARRRLGRSVQCSSCPRPGGYGAPRVRRHDRRHHESLRRGAVRGPLPVRERCGLRWHRPCTARSTRTTTRTGTCVRSSRLPGSTRRSSAKGVLGPAQGRVLPRPWADSDRHPLSCTCAGNAVAVACRHDRRVGTIPARKPISRSSRAASRWWLGGWPAQVWRPRRQASAFRAQVTSPFEWTRSGMPQGTGWPGGGSPADRPGGARASSADIAQPPSAPGGAPGDPPPSRTRFPG